MKDQIFTPTKLADDLVSLAKVSNPSSIADFAAGDGALLKAANKTWPEAALFAVDIDHTKKQNIRSWNGQAKFHCADFIDDGGQNGIGAILPATGVDLVLLNPPFSNRDKVHFDCVFDGKSYRAGKALIFVVRALSYLSATGELLALIPQSVLVSERDFELWRAIENKYSVEILENRESAFAKHGVRIALVRFSNDRVAAAKSNKSKMALRSDLRVQLMRGSLSVNKSAPVGEKARLSFVHTTNLQGHKVVAGSRCVAHRKTVSGSVVLLPRVGRPKKGKLVLHKSKTKFVLSDCVIGLKTVPEGSEEQLFRILLDAWPRLVQTYSGSCASYITLARMSAFLEDIGIASEIVNTFQEVDLLSYEKCKKRA